MDERTKIIGVVFEANYLGMEEAALKTKCKNSKLFESNIELKQRTEKRAE